MLRLALITALTIAILSPAQRESRPAGDAGRFVSLEGRFSISLPDTFNKKTILIPTPVGKAYGNLYQWKTNEGVVGVDYADAIEPITDPDAVKQFFDGATERFKKFVVENNGNVGVVKKITLDKYPGIEQRANINMGPFIERTYLVSRRIYQVLVIVMNGQQDENTAVRTIDSFKVLSDAELTEEALKAAPDPLPQTPEAPRAGTDAGDKGLRGPVKSVRTEIQYLYDSPLTNVGTKVSLTTYNEKGNMLRTDSYDFKNNLEQITVYGYLDGARVSTSKTIQHEYDPPLVRRFGDISSKPMDPRYRHRFEFKYDDKKRLIEQTRFLSNGVTLERYVYKYEGSQKEELVYLEGGASDLRYREILDDKGNVIEQTYVERNGSVSSKTSYTYEFDSHGNWTKQTSYESAAGKAVRRPQPRIIRLRTITYY